MDVPGLGVALLSLVGISARLCPSRPLGIFLARSRYWAGGSLSIRSLYCWTKSPRIITGEFV
jgi:hypothetical protein